MTVEDVGKAASECKTTTRVEGDGFHPEVPLDLSGDKCGRSTHLSPQGEDRRCLANNIVYFACCPHT